MLKKLMVVMYLAVFVLSAGLAQAYAPPLSVPEIALNNLRDGNARYLLGTLTNLNANSGADTRQTVAQSQHPFAIVLDCSDSRLSPEIIFDQGLGQLFVVRVAGNVIAPHQIASIEYAIEHLGAKLVVVLGHERCGAVSAAYGSFNADGTTTAAYSGLTKDLKELVTAIKQPVIDTKNSTNSVTDCILNNTHKVTSDLKANSEVIAGILGNPLTKDEIGIIEAFYDLDDGIVTFTTDFAGNPTGDKFFTVKASATGSGVITPSGDSAVHGKGGQKFFVTPNDGFSLIKVTDNGADVTSSLTAGSATTQVYDLTGVNENHTIVAQFSAPLAPAIAPAYLNIQSFSDQAKSVYLISAPSSTTGAQYNFEFSTDSGASWSAIGAASATRNPTFTLPAPGDYQFRVYVTATGAAASASTAAVGSIAVTSAMAAPAYLNIQTKFPATGKVYLISAPSKTTTPGLNYVFEYNDGTTGWQVGYTGAARNPTIQLPGSGTYSFRVKVIDSLGVYTTDSGYVNAAGSFTY